MLWNHIFSVKQNTLENSSRVDNYSSKWTSRNRVKQGHPPWGQRSFSFSLPLLWSLSSHVLGMPCPSFYSTVLVLPLAALVRLSVSPSRLSTPLQPLLSSPLPNACTIYLAFIVHYLLFWLIFLQVYFATHIKKIVNTTIQKHTYIQISYIQISADDRV